MVAQSTLTPLGVDARGNRWLGAALAADSAERLAATHARWAEAPDADIVAAKTAVACAAGVSGSAMSSMRGMACADFLYIFNDEHQHFFVPVGAGTRMLVYEGECDMYWSPDATFDMIQLQVDMAQSTEGNPLPHFIAG